jgi:hypothetical protein
MPATTPERPGQGSMSVMGILRKLWVKATKILSPAYLVGCVKSCWKHEPRYEHRQSRI